MSNKDDKNKPNNSKTEDVKAEKVKADKAKSDKVKTEKQEKKEERKAEKKEAKRLDKERIKEERRLDREARFKIENPVKFMRIITIVGVFFAVFAAFFAMKYIVNLVFLINYDKGNYSVETEEFLQHLNIPEGYLPHYNAGNAHYKLEEYDKAIVEYQMALEAHPGEKKECDIRVNLALAMLKKINFDHLDTEKDKENAIRTLQAARNVLCEKGCADPYGTDGHDPEAEQLKQDIDKMLEELGAEPEPPKSDNDKKKQSKGSGKNDKKQTQREKQLQKELNEQKKENNQERRDYQDQKDMQGGSESEQGGGASHNQDEDIKTW